MKEVLFGFVFGVVLVFELMWKEVWIWSEVWWVLVVGLR